MLSVPLNIGGHLFRCLAESRPSGRNSREREGMNNDSSLIRRTTCSGRKVGSGSSPGTDGIWLWSYRDLGRGGKRGWGGDGHFHIGGILISTSAPLPFLFWGLGSLTSLQKRTLILTSLQCPFTVSFLGAGFPY